MKKSIKLFAIFIVLTIFSQVSIVALASEESSIIVAYDAVNKAITIDGTSNAPALSPVTVNVTLSENGAPSDSNTPVISGMFFADTDGRLTYSAPLAEDFPAGKYNVYVGMMHLENAYVATVMVFDKNSQETADVIELINDVKSASEMTEVVTEGASALGIDKDTVEDMNAVCKVVYGIFKAEGAFDYEEFDRAFKTGLASEMIADGDSVDSVMNKYSSVFNTDYDTYSALGDVKSVFDSLFLKADLSKGFTEFADVELMADVISTETVDDFKKLILDNTEFFVIDIDDDYEDLSSNNRTKVFKLMFAERKDFVTAEDVADEFEKAVKNIEKDVENKKQSSSSGSGGSGYSVSYPVSEEKEPVKDEPADDGQGNNEQTNQKVPSVEYTDIKGHFSEDAVYKLSELEILNGFEDSSFKPDDYVTRAQLAKMTVFALKLTLSANAKNFDDVSDDEWYYEYINILSSNDIVSGDGLNFYPDSLVTRQDAAVILYRALKACGKEINGSAQFADSETISSYAKDAVGAMAENGIIKGDSEGFRPLSSLTRGEAAVLIDRIIEKL